MSENHFYTGGGDGAHDDSNIIHTFAHRGNCVFALEHSSYEYDDTDAAVVVQVVVHFFKICSVHQHVLSGKPRT